MAANDYYNNSSTAYSSHAGPDTNKPLPGATAPTAAQSQQSISPVTSPFDDRNRFDYNTSQQHLASGGAGPAGYHDNDTSYHGSGSANRYDPPVNQNYQNDPFADQNAIPLQNQGKMGTPYSADPEGRMYPPGPGVPEKRRKKGWFSGRITWVVYILTTVQIGVFVGELIKNGILTGSPIQTKPSFNYMIGPSYNVLINMGARYSPCMHNIEQISKSRTKYWPCPNSTSDVITHPSNMCTLSERCGMGGVPEQTHPSDFRDRRNEPDQWWRFITPIFLHAGIVHLGFNMLLQLTLGRDMEKELGSLRFAVVYFSAGIFGFVLGGNYATPTQPSVGASGALFGILALVLLDLLYNWRTRRSPVKDLLFLLLDIAIAFVLGLLPFLDNFAHIGGFLCGIILGICLMHSPPILRERIGTDEPPYATVDTQPLNSGAKPAISKFVKQPMGFFKGRKPFWWAWWLVRAGALVAVFVGFILLLRNFYVVRKHCSWCHRLSCLPIRDWCDNRGFNFTEVDAPKNETTTSKMIRDVLEGMLDLTLDV